MNPTKFAAMRFRGKPSKENEAAKKLIKKIQDAGFSISKNAKPIFAYYDPPWIPVFLRKNVSLIGDIFYMARKYHCQDIIGSFVSQPCTGRTISTLAHGSFICVA